MQCFSCQIHILTCQEFEKREGQKGSKRYINVQGLEGNMRTMLYKWDSNYHDNWLVILYDGQSQVAYKSDPYHNTGLHNRML